MVYYRDSLVALRMLRACPTDAPILEGTGFVGLTPSEFEARISEMRRELDDQVEMSLCAAYEAQLRTDYLARSALKTKDKASIELRRLFRAHGESVELDQILEGWKKVIGGLSKAIGEFRQVVKFRHWLAHGKYWNQKSGLTNPTPEEVYRRGEELCHRLQPAGFPMARRK